MDYLREESTRKRQRGCQLYPRGDYVSVRSSEEHGTGFAGVQSCGSVTCPHCGGKIAAQRRTEIMTAVSSWESNGGVLLFGTLTLKHDKTNSLDALLDAASKSWGRVTSGRGWQEDQAWYGIRGWVRVWETVYNEKNGWHVHVHFLLMVDEEPSSIPKLLGRLFSRWAKGAKSKGLSSPLIIGQDLHRVTGEDAAHQLSSYLAKEPDGGSAESMAHEMTSGDWKKSLGSKTPRQLLELAANGNELASFLWMEYELALKNRRTIGWSRGLRALLLLEEEKSDQEIADEEAGDVEDTVLSMVGKQWVKFGRIPGNRLELLEILELFGVELAVAFLRENGVHSWPGKPPARD